MMVWVGTGSHLAWTRAEAEGMGRRASWKRETLGVEWQSLAAGRVWE